MLANRRTGVFEPAFQNTSLQQRGTVLPGGGPPWPTASRRKPEGRSRPFNRNVRRNRLTAHWLTRGHRATHPPCADRKCQPLEDGCVHVRAPKNPRPRFRVSARRTTRGSWAERERRDSPEYTEPPARRPHSGSAARVLPAWACTMGVPADQGRVALDSDPTKGAQVTPTNRPDRPSPRAGATLCRAVGLTVGRTAISTCRRGCKKCPEHRASARDTKVQHRSGGPLQGFRGLRIALAPGCCAGWPAVGLAEKLKPESCCLSRRLVESSGPATAAQVAVMICHQVVPFMPPIST